MNEKSNGMSPLMFAARYNKVEIIKILLSNGAILNAKDEKGFTALNMPNYPMPRMPFKF